jgi:hypothetical protein
VKYAVGADLHLSASSTDGLPVGTCEHVGMAREGKLPVDGTGLATSEGEDWG